ncbi:MAG: glycosyltransferase family 2 protein [Dehalococcoidia bacterium]|nr:glycosyltransferase family 2 protein [Dehalococcoidia bacterium]
MSESPKVSVVIPTYNRAALLPRAVNSVLTQTCQDFEVLIVDDCSSDDTPAVAAGFADPRVRYFRHETNRGLSAGVNTGIANARGEFVALLEDDDALTPDSLADRLAVFESAPPEVALVYGYMDRVNDATGQRRTGLRFALEGEEAFEFSLRAEAFAGIQVMLFRTSAAREIGGFDERLTMGCDALFLCSILSKYRIIALRKVVALSHEQHGHPQVTDWDNLPLIDEHHAIHMRQFAEELEQRPHVLDYLRRIAPAHLSQMKALRAVQRGELGSSLRWTLRSYRMRPFYAVNLLHLLRLAKFFIFYVTPLSGAREPLKTAQRRFGLRKT